MCSETRRYGFESSGRLISSIKSLAVFGRMNCSVLETVHGVC